MKTGHVFGLLRPFKERYPFHSCIICYVCADTNIALAAQQKNPAATNDPATCTATSAALNVLFGKLVQRKLGQRHLLRSGYGRKELRADTDCDFSVRGRIDCTLVDFKTMVLMSKWEDLDELDIIEQCFAKHRSGDDYVISEYKALRGVAINEAVVQVDASIPKHFVDHLDRHMGSPVKTYVWNFGVLSQLQMDDQQS